MRDKFGVDVYCDDAETKDRILKYSKLGVKGFVLGTAVLFVRDRPYTEIVRDFKAELMAELTK